LHKCTISDGDYFEGEITDEYEEINRFSQKKIENIGYFFNTLRIYPMMINVLLLIVVTR